MIKWVEVIRLALKKTILSKSVQLCFICVEKSDFEFSMLVPDKKGYYLSDISFLLLSKS